MHCPSHLSLAAMLSTLVVATAPIVAGERPSALSAKELRLQVDAALRLEATAKTTDQRRAAVRSLVNLVGTIDAASSVSTADRQRERNRVRARLAQVHQEIARPDTVGRVTGRDRPPLLAQVAPAGAAGAGNPPAPADHGDDLAELIRQTIAPETWDVNGGNGVIIYFPARRVLVVRQTAEVHWDLADVIDQLQRN